MKKKCKCPDGVPEWVVTFGDMMSLLLTFFILLAAFSELKKEDEYQEVVKSIQEAFGYKGGAGMVPTNDAPTKSIIQKIQAIALYKEKVKEVSKAQDPGTTGKDTTVQTIREGLLFTVGGYIAFERGSDELTEEGKAAIAKVARSVRGHNNKIEVRGHASHDDRAHVKDQAGLWRLSNARALRVMRELTSDVNGLRPQRIRVVAASVHEPLKSYAYDDSRMAVNRRAEILVHETLVQDFEDKQPSPKVTVAPPE